VQRTVYALVETRLESRMQQQGQTPEQQDHDGGKAEGQSDPKREPAHTHARSR
jgi:hypothetical protein